MALDRVTPGFRTGFRTDFRTGCCDSGCCDSGGDGCAANGVGMKDRQG
jgi:hypothetical protein